jgi:hypothetical protein
MELTFNIIAYSFVGVIAVIGAIALAGPIVLDILDMR